ncbi:serine/threonine-protein kinase [Streptomyces sp. ISL-94]|uniref:serine/threonine-protein kinase n=1 Tax=Streptomyces sp. ISL-94 TaxID=2819190 RepID=UPI001BE69B1A|nr:serine/threonine-protein kinase [Streptomyces sp. ISL-94]MBT2480333.1 serine/threonine protein kinase [Streptomyces sp. ISL-94]
MPEQPIAGRYELLEGLGSGGMGEVWRGYDAVLDRPVAVKLISRQAMANAPQLAQEFTKRFHREARITARIQHPGVPQVYDAGLDDAYERLFLVMELVEGVPLSAYVRPDRPLPVSWAAAVAAQVATVLSHAHEVPVIHRDLKPGNILVARDGTVKVLDFGIAAILRTDVTKLTSTGSPMGTSQYMSPEQVRGGRITPQADLYALGCVLHELLSGRPLFSADNEYALMFQHVSAAPTPLRALRPDVPTALEELVLHLLLKAPEARPADVQEVYERLRPFLPPPGQKPAPGEAGPDGAPDPTGIFRNPYAPRARRQAGTGAQQPVQPDLNGVPAAPAPVPARLREEIKEAYAHSDALLEEERFAQAAEVLGEIIEPAARALGSENRQVLELRTQRAAIQLLGGDYRAALPEFDALADAYARTGGTTGEQARACRAQAARCRAELGQVTAALTALRGVLDVVRAVDGDVSEEAVELRRDIGMLLLAQGQAAEARLILEPLHEDLRVVFGPGDEMTQEIAEALALIRLGLDGPAT